MNCNAFIESILENLSLVSPRLQDDIAKLQIIFELNNEYVFSIITYFLQIQEKYKYDWNLINQQYIDISNIDSCTGTYTINNNTSMNLNINPIDIKDLSPFQDFYTYLKTNKFLNDIELEWLEDSIHTTLLNY